VEQIFSAGERPRKLSECDEWLLLRQIDVLRRQESSFTLKRLMLEAGIDARTVSCKTVRRLLHRHGYKYIQARRKRNLNSSRSQNKAEICTWYKA